MTYAATSPGAGLPEVSSPLEVRFGERLPQSRLTALFRPIMLIPQLVVLFFVGIAAVVVAIIGWFGALFTGRLPQFAVEFLGGFLRWQTRVMAYAHFLTGTYPPFSLQPVAEYPVDIWVQTGKLNRWSVLFRIILVIPAAIVATVLEYGLAIFYIVLWAATVILGRVPEAFFDATAAVVRFETRYLGYYSMLTSFYPAAVYGDGTREEVTAAAGQWAGAPATAAWPPAPGQAPAPGTFAPPYPTAGTVAPAPPPPPPPGAAPFAPPPMPATAYGPPPVGVPAYGPPPAAPPVVEPPLAWSPWRLLVSSRGRVLLTVFIVLGALGYVGSTVGSGSFSSSSNAVTAQNQAVDAYAQAYGNAVQSAGLSTVLSRVDTTFNDLNAALLSA